MAAAPDASRSAAGRKPSSPDAAAVAPRASWPLRGLFVIAVIAVLKAAQDLLIPVALAVVLTFVLATPVRLLRRRGIPEAFGAALLVGALLGVTAMGASALATPAAQWWERAPAALDQLLVEVDRVRASFPILAPRPAPSPRAARTAAPADPVKDRIASEGVTLTRVFIERLIGLSISAAAMVILLYFLLASEHWMLSRTVEAIPRRRARCLVLSGVRTAQREIGRYLGTLALVNVGLGLVTAAAMALVGLPNPLLWGTMAALLNFIPYIGPLMVVVLLTLAALLTFGTSGPLLVPALAFLLIHAIESNLVTPWFVGRRLTLSPISVFLAVMFGGWLWGIAGAVIAVPTLLGLRSICKRSRRLRIWCVYLEGAHREPPSLRSLVRRRSPSLAPRGSGPAASG